MKLTKKQEKEIWQVYDTWLNSYLNGDVKTYDSFLDDDYHFIGSATKEEFLNKKDTTKFFAETGDQFAGKTEIRNESKIIEQFGELIFITHVLDCWFLHEKEWNFYSRFRFSSTLRKNKDGWRFIYQHFSIPDPKTAEGETIGYDKINEENQELREAIQRRTIELEQKNRELEVETALERIRAQAVAMKESSDLLDIVVTMRNEFIKLGHEAHYFWHMMWLPETYEKAMTSGDGSKIGFVMQLPRHIHGDIPLLAKWEKSKKQTVVYAMNVDEALDYVDKMVTLGDFKNIDPQAPTEDDIRHIGGLTFIMARTSHGEIGYSLPGIVKNPPKEDIEILVKFASAFDLAHRRFLDLQKAEHQAREVQIELALEKVRSQSMTMQKSEELGSVVNTLFEQFKILHLNFSTCWISLMDEGQNTLEYWVKHEGDEISPVKVHASDHDNFNKEIKAWKNNVEFINIPTPYANAVTALKEIFNIELENKVGDFTFHLLNIRYQQGYIGIGSFHKANNQTLDILKRFVIVFEQAYTRFLDLQKAEAQAREVEIELALERVRARTMAMQHSDELQEASFLLDQQVRALGIKTWGCAFNIYGEKESAEWFGNEAGVLPTYTVPHKGIFEEYYQKGQKGESFFIKEFSGKACIDHYEYMSSLPVIGDVLKNLKKTNKGFPTYQIDHIAYFKYGYLLFITKEHVPESHDIFKRFAKVFEQTYTRFLDLQKAEAQTREAQIEAALERIRSRTMAMHKSEELSEVAIELNKEFRGLGFPKMFESGYVEIDEENNIQKGWLSNFEGDQMEAFSMPLKLDSVLNNRYKAWKKKEPLFYQKIGGKKLLDHVAKVVPHLDSEEVAQVAKNQFSDPTHFYFGYLTVGTLCIISHEQLNSEQENLVKRFTKVFEQTYTRFLDLQKAEAQAREAQIEVSLERVRSKAMAMHNSDDLSDTISMVFIELRKLGVNPIRSGVGLFSKESRKVQLYSATSSESGENLSLVGWVQLEKHPVLEKIYKSWTQQKDYFPKLQGKQLKTYYQSLLAGLSVPIPDFKNNQNQFGHFTPFSIGCLYAWSDDYFSDDQLNIFKRFASIVDLTFRRYLDLVKAEAQAREAQIEASLERLRSASMAMHKTEDISDVVLVYFEQLKLLNIEFVQSWITIFHLDQSLVDVWFSPIEGLFESTTHFQMPSTLFEDTSIKSWKEGLPFSYISLPTKADVNQFMKMCDDVIQTSYFGDIQKKLKLQKLEFLDANNKYGCISKSNIVKATSEDEEILQRFSKVFEQTYTRFLDLQKAEAQTRTAQINLAVERVRAKALAMHKSEEIMEVVAKLKDEVMALDIPDVIAATIFLKEGEDKVRMWDLTTLEKDDNGYQVPFDITFKLKKTDPHLYVKRVWENQDNYFHEKQETKDLKRIVAWLKENDKTEIADEVEEFTKTTQLKCLHHAVKKLNNGKLAIDLLNTPSDEMETILTKMGAAFDLAYKRFEDLQKAEAQAREAQIEASLERVRARAMAMYQTDELTDVLGVLFDQFELLGINPALTHLTLFDEANNTFSLRITTSGKKRVIAEQIIDIDTIEAWRSSYENWKKSELHALDLIDYKSKDLPLLWEVLDEVMSALPNENKIYPEDFPNGLYTTQGHCKFGYLGLNSERKATEEEKEIVVKFAKEFGRLYQRFLDLQKAETQAREAQIETALEKIRSRSLAMHQSEELWDVVSEMFSQLEVLEIPADSCFINIFQDKNPKDMNFYAAAGGQVYKDYIFTPYSNIKIFNRLIEARKNKESFYSIILNKEEKDHFWKHFFSTSTNVTVSTKRKNYIAKTTGLSQSVVVGKYASIHMMKYVPIPYLEEENKVLRRFGKAFDQVYTRFLDLQKSEAQAREAQIEAALERVRSRSMAMHSTSELQDVIKTVHNEFTNLDIAITGGVFIAINEDIKKEINCWGAGGTTDYIERVSIPLFNGAIYTGIIKKIKKGPGFFTEVFSNSQKKRFFEHLFKHPPYSKTSKKHKLEIMNRAGGYTRSCAVSENTTIFMINHHGEEFSEADNKILRRFAKVFEQTYTRFLDLEKAETQAREALIEAALERVRSRSMAMHNSEDLKEVIQVLYDQFVQLKIPIEHAGFILDYKENDDMHIWLADQHAVFPEVTLPYFDCAHWNSFNNAKKKGQNFFTNQLGFKEKNKFYKDLFEFLPDLPEDTKNAYFKFDGLAISTVLLNTIGLYIENYSGIPFSEDENAILMRFGKVFEQTYTRFLDLKKAEAQAREAQIEAALERVRSRSMAMHNSDELQEVIQSLFEQLQLLNFNIDAANFVLNFRESDTFNLWAAVPGQLYPEKIIIPYIDTPVLNSFREARDKGLEFCTDNFTYKEKNEFFINFFKHVKNIPKKRKDYMLNTPGYARSSVLLNSIALYILNYQGIPYSKDENDILKRFAAVFEQSYTRFMDLQKAETQAREAQIEMALEKVRSRTMAMQKSTELPEAANNLFLQVQELGIPAWSAGYCIWENEDKKSAWCNMSSEGEIQKGFSLPTIGEGYNFYDPLKNGESFYVDELGGEALVKHYEFMTKLPIVGEIFEEFNKKGITLPTFQIFHIVYFKHGYVMFITYESVTKDWDIFKRFGNVFEQTYTRFLDLKKAEEQAREAQIEAALERVRSQSMGMQSTNDFAQVTTEMFNQLRNFGEDLFATGIVFCDKHKGHVEQWHSIPGGGMLSPMIVPIDLDYIHQYRYDQWKKGTELFSIEIPSDFIEQHFEDIFKLPSAQITLKDLESRNAPMPETPPWEIDYGASFKNGYILASSLKPLENMDILPRFAKVFEQAYTRYLDLQKAENRAREAQIEMALEKVRSRTMTMEYSSELAETSVVVFKELLNLGIAPNRLFIGIIKDNGNLIDAWATNEDGSKIESRFTLQVSKNKSIKKMVTGWKQHKKSVIIDLKGKELQDYFRYLNEEMKVPFIDGLKQKRRVQTVAYFSGGLIGMAASEEQPQETTDLLERFASVFNLTYTRFNDLKIAEKQAKQAEEDLINLQKAKKRAEQALSELQSTQKQLIQSEKMASLGELTAGIAHEIQNPLNFVNNFSEVSKELLDEMIEELENGDMEEVKAITDDVIQNLEKINHHGKRADSIVKGMLQHSRATGDKKEPTNINALADEYLRLAYHGLRAKDKSFNATLVTDFDENIGNINILPQDIGRVVLNLLTNAFYVVNEKKQSNKNDYEPTVSISTKKNGNWISISVKDNGNGIPKKVLDKIFQPFFTTKPTGQGTGLGLSMSYDIITKGHEGELKVNTQQNKGTEFIIKLPI